MNIGTVGGSWAAPMTYSQPLPRTDRTGSDPGRAATGAQSVSAVRRAAGRNEQQAAERTPWIDKAERARIEKKADQADEEQKAERAAQEKERAERPELPPLEGLTLEEVRIILGALPVMASYQQQDRSASAVLDVRV